MKVEGDACDRVQEGTGFVAGARPHRHERARGRGESTHAGRHRPTARRLDTDVVAFDPNRDLAVLQRPRLGCCTARTRARATSTTRLALRPPGRRSAARVADAHRRADRRPRHQHRAHRRHRARGVRARRRHRTRRLRRPGRRHRGPGDRRAVRLRHQPRDHRLRAHACRARRRARPGARRPVRSPPVDTGACLTE